MGFYKRIAEEVSYLLGYDGEINNKVIETVDSAESAEVFKSLPHIPDTHPDDFIGREILILMATRPDLSRDLGVVNLQQMSHEQKVSLLTNIKEKFCIKEAKTKHVGYLGDE